jgi:uncharacterized protein YjbI with pentapeptide repeats
MSDADVIAHELRAWTPSGLLSAYARGQRDFRAINLLREELEAVYGDTSTRFRYSDRWDWEKRNPLWIDYTDRGDDFSWDRSGHCLFDEMQDLPESRALSQQDLAGINLQGSYLYPIDFAGTSLQGADLRSCIFLDCDLSSVDLSRADLRDARIDGCIVERANFYMARMDRCRITSRRATSSNFKRAKLKKALLLGLDLKGATFQWAHFDRTVLNGCDLRGVDLSSVRLFQTMVDGVTISPEQSDTLLKALDVQVVSTTPE